MTTRNVVIFPHHLLLVDLLYVVMPWPMHWTLMLAVPGFAILLVTLIGGATALGLVCARLGDVSGACNSSSSLRRS